MKCIMMMIIIHRGFFFYKAHAPSEECALFLNILSSVKLIFLKKCYSSIWHIMKIINGLIPVLMLSASKLIRYILYGKYNQRQKWKKEGLCNKGHKRIYQWCQHLVFFTKYMYTVFMIFKPSCSCVTFYIRVQIHYMV